MKTTCTLGAVVMMTFGCGVSPENIGEESRLGDVSLEEGDEAPVFVDGSLSVTSPQMSGQIGEQFELDRGTMTVDGFQEAAFASIATHVNLGSGAAMSVVDVFGGLDHADFYGEEPAEFSDDEFPQGGEAYVSVLGCSGPEAGEWEYDRYSESVRVQALPNDDDTVEFRYQARFATWDQSARSFVNGSFVLSR